MSVATNSQLRDLLKAGRVVMRGPFEEHDAVSVLQALSISRQLTAVELYDEEDTIVGSVFLKSGVVLAVDAPGLGVSGLEAFYQLMQRPLRSYRVYRLPPIQSYPLPIGRLTARLMADAAQFTFQATTARELARSEPPSAAPAQDSVSSSPPKGPSMPPPSTVAVRSTRSSSQPTATKSASRPIVAISSPKGGSGKTTISLNLAVSLARQGLRVILVDADPNGDILSAIGARERARSGAYEAALTGEDPHPRLMRTVVDGLSLLPAMGLDFPLEKLDTAPTATQWREVFLALSVHADIVLVDTPAGVFGGTTSILQACTHVLGVLQAEVISKRSFSMFERALTAMTGAPAVVGVVINMFQRSQGASLAVFADATSDMPPSWVFDTTIPRSNDFLSSSDAGMPLRLMPDSGPSTITWLFDMLGSEVRERLHITAAASTPPTSFLLD